MNFKDEKTTRLRKRQQIGSSENRVPATGKELVSSFSPSEQRDE